MSIRELVVDTILSAVIALFPSQHIQAEYLLIVFFLNI